MGERAVVAGWGGQGRVLPMGGHSVLTDSVCEADRMVVNGSGITEGGDF